MGFRRRLTVLLLLAGCGALAIWLRVGQLQVLEGATWEKAARSLREKRERSTAPRGRIVDRDGLVIAEDEPGPRLAVIPWEWERRDRWRCTACGAVQHAPKPGATRPPRRCACRLPGQAFEALPPADLGPLEALLGLEPGDLDAAAHDRIYEISDLADAYEKRLEDAGEDDFFIEDKKGLYRDDMLRRPHPIRAGTLPPEAVRLIELDEQGRFRGLRIQTVLTRVYPQGDLAPQLFGYTQPLFREEYEKLRAAYGPEITPDVRIGRRGLERAYDGLLRGQPGWRHLARDEDGAFTVVLGEEPPAAGMTLKLSLSVAASREAERLIDLLATPEGFAPGGRPSGAFVAMYADTGEIVAWGEAPRFDPVKDLAKIASPAWNEADFDPLTGQWVPRHELPEGESADSWRAKLVQPDAIVLSRVADIPVEPGSTMKVLIALAMLESGHGLPWEERVCTGHGAHPPHCHHAHGSVGFEEALCVSCNQYFAATLADSPLRHLYRTSVASFVDRLGVGHPVFSDFTGSRGRGIWLRLKEWGEQETPEIGPWDGRYVAIGQGRVTTTPLHMVRTAALLANGGRLVTPHVVATVGGAPQPAPAAEFGVSPVSLSRVREGLFRVVNHPRGTADTAGFDRVPATVYGKTGTAQVGGTYRPGQPEDTGDGPWHHWFMGWAEAPGTRTIAFCALLHARHEAAAGATAAPLAAQFLSWWYEQGQR